MIHYSGLQFTYLFWMINENVRYFIRSWSDGEKLIKKGLGMLFGCSRTRYSSNYDQVTTVEIFAVR